MNGVGVEGQKSRKYIRSLKCTLPPPALVPLPQAACRVIAEKRVWERAVPRVCTAGAHLQGSGTGEETGYQAWLLPLTLTTG